MSLTGIKDISIIDEPPGDRLPVHTFVTPYEEEIMRNAIERELARGGQVFIVNNRITGLNQIRETVERLVPHAVTAIGHGRMSEDTLESTMLDFVEGRINVLIATTIIENGIDIPNANTMIILNADRFGLAQLYQLRGRVGRSSRLAYAYLMYQPGKVLTEIARKRLAAIREFTEFGAGFKLAMRDLELRGAGNILGEAQSGHIESIGYELYCKEIDRAVRQLKGEDVGEARSDISIELPVHASIPADYIPDETLRLEAYRRIAGILDSDDAMDVIDELTDRYGDVPEEALELINVAEIRAHAEYLGVSEISRTERWVNIKFAGGVRVHPFVFVMAKSEYGDRMVLIDGRTTMLKYNMGKELDTAAVLGIMRFLRAAKEESKQFES
jgi:transcription-repair coupling factor (superfamily II helicase)